MKSTNGKGGLVKKLLGVAVSAALDRKSVV